MMGRDIRAEIDNGPMSVMQIVSVAVCLLINMIDGFDVLVIAFTAPEIAEEWGISMQSLGVLFSAGLFGMAAGSLFLAPVADKIGRRPLILICLVVTCIGMWCSAFSESTSQLAMLRAITGLGIGGILAALTTIVAEYSSKKRRGLAISLLMTGFPIGATLGGLAAVYINLHYGWRAVFLFGAILTLLMIPIALFKLPESIAFLTERRPPKALSKINIILSKMGRQTITEMTPHSADSMNYSMPTRALLETGSRRNTLLLWCSFFMLMMSFYFVMSWTPKLLVSSGLRIEEGMSGGVIINLGGIVGGGLFGLLAGFFLIKRLLTVYMLGSVLAMICFVGVIDSLAVLLVIGFIIGFFFNGSMAGLYTIGPELYPVSARSTGMGWAIGIGRFGAILGPFLAGILLDSGWSVEECFIIFASPFIIALLAVRYLQIPTPNSKEPSQTRDRESISYS